MRDIQMVLERWGIWSRYRYETDYPSIAAGFNGILPNTGSSGKSCTDSDALTIDACVGRLKQKRPDEYELLKEYYIKGIPKRQIARQKRKDEKLIRVKIQMAEGFVDGCLAMLDSTLEMDS